LQDRPRSRLRLDTRQGAKAKVVQRLLSHENPAMTLDLHSHAHSQDDALNAAAMSFQRVVTTRDTQTGPGK
jgi:integrase